MSRTVNECLTIYESQEASPTICNISTVFAPERTMGSARGRRQWRSVSQSSRALFSLLFFRLFCIIQAWENLLAIASSRFGRDMEMVLGAMLCLPPLRAEFYTAAPEFSLERLAQGSRDGKQVGPKVTWYCVLAVFGCRDEITQPRGHLFLFPCNPVSSSSDRQTTTWIGRSRMDDEEPRGEDGIGERIRLIHSEGNYE